MYDIFDFDRYGVYVAADGAKFYSKIECALYCNARDIEYEWEFNESYYDQIDWSVEPELSIGELYARRARELRDQYDYIVISYSGGADSHNVLMSFYRQGLHVDEVLTNHITKVTENVTDFSGKDYRPQNCNAEHQLNAVAKLQWIHTNMPRTLVSEVDTSDAVLDAFNPIDESWVLSQNDRLNIAYRYRTNYFYLKAFKNRLDTGKKIGFVLGIDKPRTLIENNMLMVSFADATVFNSSIYDHNVDYDNVTIEPFYWATSTAPMICKQVHIIKRFIEQSPGRAYYWDIKKGYSFKVARTYHERWLRTLLYTTWNNSWYQADKGEYTWNTEFDDWWRNRVKGSTHELLWNQGIEFLQKNAKDYIVYKNGKADSLKPFVAKYPICQMKSSVNFST